MQKESNSLSANDKKYNILIVDDSKSIIMTLTLLLEEAGYNVTSSINGQEAITSIINEKPDLIILDIQMPVLDGYKTIERLKMDNDTSNIPVIFHTADTKPETIKHLFELGASDYICKPVVPEELLIRVAKEIQNVSLHNEIKDKMSRLAVAISRDSLTQANNKHHIVSIINKMMKRLKEEDKGIFSLIYIDIDNFHSFNGVHDLKHSNRALKEFASTIKDSLKENDVLARWEGDRFMVLLPQTAKERLQKVAKKILDDTNKKVFSPQLDLTCSIVIKEISPEDDIQNTILTMQKTMKKLKSARRNSIFLIENK